MECWLGARPLAVIITGWMRTRFLIVSRNISILFRIDAAVAAVKANGLRVYLASHKLTTLSPRIITKSICALLEVNPMAWVLTPSIPNDRLICGK